MEEVARYRLVSPTYPAPIPSKHASAIESMARMGLFLIESQEDVAWQPIVAAPSQRAYLTALTSRGQAAALCAQLNRIPGIVAFWHRNKTQFTARLGAFYVFHDVFVTYEKGNPVKSLPMTSSVLDQIQEWSPELAEHLQHPRYVVLTILNTLYSDTLFSMTVNLLEWFDRQHKLARATPTAPNTTVSSLK
jgi:hypothetical protein